MVDLLIDQKMLFSRVGWGVTEDDRVILMLGTVTDDGAVVTGAAAIMEVEDARKCVKHLRMSIEEATRAARGKHK
jgi:hypothetical protein